MANVGVLAAGGKGDGLFAAVSITTGGTVLDCSNALFRYLNHSCKPNAEIIQIELWQVTWMRIINFGVGHVVKECRAFYQRWLEF
jgi:hypothetical protein